MKMPKWIRIDDVLPKEGEFVHWWTQHDYCPEFIVKDAMQKRDDGMFLMHNKDICVTSDASVRSRTSYWTATDHRTNIIHVDMDGVLADYETAAMGKDEQERRERGFFEGIRPLDGAVEAYHELCKHYDVHILSTAPWSNVHSSMEKRLWVEKYLGDAAFKKLTTSHHKDLLKGDFLIDDRKANGSDLFEGMHIHFGTDAFPDWPSVLAFLERDREKA